MVMNLKWSNPCLDTSLGRFGRETLPKTCSTRRNKGSGQGSPRARRRTASGVWRGLTNLASQRKAVDQNPGAVAAVPTSEALYPESQTVQTVLSHGARACQVKQTGVATKSLGSDAMPIHQ